MFAKKMSFAIYAVVVAAAGVWMTDVAKADDAAENAAIAAAAITLQQAIQTAESAADGKAVESGVDDDDDSGMYYYKVEVRAADGSEKKVLIDMKTGKVVKTEADD